MLFEKLPRPYTPSFTIFFYKYYVGLPVYTATTLQHIEMALTRHTLNFIHTLTPHSHICTSHPQCSPIAAEQRRGTLIRYNISSKESPLKKIKMRLFSLPPIIPFSVVL